jgi:NAD(P)-dependent dehydrogenase (short-subunit alcohol dehydrogenase family)
MADMTGKICLVTGATNGIGKVTALALAKMGATVFVVGRNPEKTDTVVKAIRRVSGSANVHKLLADLSVQAQVRDLAAAFKSQQDHLDVLVNNAGALFMRREESADGIEMTWALNHLNYFLLTNLLLESLQHAPAARVVNVSSGAQSDGRIHFDDPELKRGYTVWAAYAQSKLANIMFTYELARRMKGTKVTANALHPGFVGTGFAANNGWLFKMGMALLKPFALSPEQGARTPIYLASSPEVEGVTGKFYINSKPARSSTASYDETAQHELWQLSEQMTGLAVTA